MADEKPGDARVSRREPWGPGCDASGYPTESQRVARKMFIPLGLRSETTAQMRDQPQCSTDPASKGQPTAPEPRRLSVYRAPLPRRAEKIIATAEHVETLAE